jgi:chromosome segregation ATPase
MYEALNENQTLLAELLQLMHESQLVREEVMRHIHFLHLHQRINGIKQIIELIRENLSHGAVNTNKPNLQLKHATEDVKSYYLEHLKETHELWEKIEKLGEEIHYTFDLEYGDLQTLSAEILLKLVEKAQHILNLIEQHPAMHIDPTPRIQQLHKRLLLIHQQHDALKKHGYKPKSKLSAQQAIHEFLNHYHSTLESLALHFHHLQLHFTEIYAKLQEEKTNLKELDALQAHITQEKQAYEEEVECLKKQIEQNQHSSLVLGTNFRQKKDPN